MSSTTLSLWQPDSRALKNYTDLIFGLHTVMEAIESGKTIDKLMMRKSLEGEQAVRLRELAKEHGISIHAVPEEKLMRITRKNHQGVVAFLSPIEFYSIQDVLPQLYEAGKTPLVLVLDRITDVRNFGAIVRTAECAGVHAVVIPLRHTAQVSSDAAKTSAGALFKVPICRENSLTGAVHFLQTSGLQVVACTEQTKDSIYQPDYTLPTAILMGSEEDGISRELLEIADVRGAIPLHGEIGSLNVSVATGIALYEVVRQRGA